MRTHWKIPKAIQVKLNISHLNYVLKTTENQFEVQRTRFSFSRRLLLRIPIAKMIHKQETMKTIMDIAARTFRCRLNKI